MVHVPGPAGVKRDEKKDRGGVRAVDRGAKRRIPSGGQQDAGSDPADQPGRTDRSGRDHTGRSAGRGGVGQTTNRER